MTSIARARAHTHTHTRATTSKAMYDDAEDKQCFTGGPDVTWCSTEHTIDAYFALHLAGWILNEPELMAAAENAETTLLGGLWNQGKGSFNQGLNDWYAPIKSFSFLFFFFRKKTNSRGLRRYKTTLT